MSTDSIETRVFEILADVLHLDASAFDPNASMDNTASWDSFNHISIVFALEEEFSISFEVAEMEAMLCVFDILEFVEAKL